MLGKAMLWPNNTQKIEELGIYHGFGECPKAAIATGKPLF